jgi:hypothetical protein
MGIDAKLLKEILETWPEYDPDQELFSDYELEKDPWVEKHQN